MHPEWRPGPWREDISRSSMKKTIIIIGGGFLQQPLIETAKRMGLATVVFDMAADAPGMNLADHTVVMSTRDTDGCVREARRLREVRALHGVLTAGTDASRAVAAVAAALDLPGIRYADAEAASNKVLMRRRLQEHGVPIPRFFSVWSLREAREAMYELEFPLVIKPAENMGARGVVKVEERSEMQAAFRHARKYSPTGEMILEEYMVGPELSIDALAWGGQIEMTGIADRIIEREPFFVEVGHNMPSAQPAVVLEEAAAVMRAGMRALGIHTGAGKGDLKVTPTGVKVGEIAARLSGGFMSSHTFPLSTGVDLYQAAIRIALGEEPGDLRPNRQRVAVERGILCEPGKLTLLGGREAMAAVPGIAAVFFTKKPGEVMPSATSNLDKVGHIVATADTLEGAEEIVAEARRHLELRTDPVYSVDWKDVEATARQRFGDDVCWVCKRCDGMTCASGVPGMGGVGNMETFRDNSRALAEYRIVPSYIRGDIEEPDTGLELFGRRLGTPILGAPMTGARTNMNDAVDEFALALDLLTGFREADSLSFVGDGASPTKIETIAEALARVQGHGALICKPRADTAALLYRFALAESLGLAAVGVDVDAVAFKTMELVGQRGRARSVAEWRSIRARVRLPFVVKGVMSVPDAVAACEMGADAIVVSNHGGRVLDEMPGTARVLPAIAAAVRGRLRILADGGVRSGADALKMLALGADAVLVGRPAAIAAVGGGGLAVRYMARQMSAELARAMRVCGSTTLSGIGPGVLERVVDDATARSTPGRDSLL